VDNYRDEVGRELERTTGARVEEQPLSLEELFLDLLGERDSEGRAAS
jgi:hypothetical protein